MKRPYHSSWSCSMQASIRLCITDCSTHTSLERFSHVCQPVDTTQCYITTCCISIFHTILVSLEASTLPIHIGKIRLTCEKHGITVEIQTQRSPLTTRW